MAARQQLVIVGAGWAGFHICQHIDTRVYDVTVIAPRRTSAYTPLLASAAVGLFGFSIAEQPVRSKARPKITFYKASVASIDFVSRTCLCEPAFDHHLPSFEVVYDKLIITPGCAPNTFGTPGVQEHAIFLKNVSDAMRLRKLLLDRLEEASLPNTSEVKVKQLLHICIVGGGPTGIEVVAELSDMVSKELAVVYKVSQFIKITVYDVAPFILGGYDKKLYTYAREKLDSLGVEVRTNTRILKVDETEIYFGDSTQQPYGLLIWATGNKNVPLIESLDVRKSEHGLKRLLTDKFLRLLDKEGMPMENVFALGDAADIEGQSLPTTAEVAVQKAAYLLNVLSGLQDTDTQPFEYRPSRMVSYIGNHDGVSSTGRTGREAWLAWRQGSITWTPSWRGRIEMLCTWVLNYVFGTKIAGL